MSTLTTSFSHEWLKTCEEANLLLAFQGDFNQDLVNAILFLTEDRHQLQESATVVKNRVFGTMVELLQNICKHGESKEGVEDGKPGIVLIGRTKESFVVSTGNLIKNDQAEVLRQTLDKLKSLSKEQLHKKHKEVLATTKLSEKSGAGLGLIGMMRKSKRLDYEVKEINNGLSFFAIEVEIATETE